MLTILADLSLPGLEGIVIFGPGSILVQVYGLAAPLFETHLMALQYSTFRYSIAGVLVYLSNATGVISNSTFAYIQGGAASAAEGGVRLRLCLFTYTNTSFAQSLAIHGCIFYQATQFVDQHALIILANNISFGEVIDSTFFQCGGYLIKVSESSFNAYSVVSTSSCRRHRSH